MDDNQPGAESGAVELPSIEDTLTKTFDEIAARPEDGAADEGIQDKPAVDKGAEGAEAAAEKDSAAEGAADTTDQDGDKGEGTAEQPLSPPERWSAADKESFKGLPRQAQDLVLKREADVERYLSQESQKIAETKRLYEPLERTIGPRREAWALQGFTPDAALDHLFALSDFATRDKPGFIRWFAQQHGVDIGTLATGADAPDPKLTALEQRVQRFEQTESQRQQQAVDQERQTVKSAVEQFAADTKAHPYFKDVEGDIAAILPSIRQQNPGASHKELLEIAYQKAIRVNDGVWQKMVAEEKRKTDLEAAEAAKKAKLAASGNVKTSGSLPDGRRNLTMDQTMSEAFDRIAARA